MSADNLASSLTMTPRPKPPSQRGPKTDFADRWERWLSIVNEKHPNSISYQIAHLVERWAVYGLILKGRERAEPDSDGRRKLNPLLYEFIDRGYFTMQLMGIRRQLDENGIDGQKGVMSLRSLIDDMNEYRSSLDRQHFFKVRGVDIAVSNSAFVERLIALSASGDGTAFIPSHDDPGRCGELHQQFNELSGANAESQHPEDCVKAEVFGGLIEQLEALRPLAMKATKYIAHSATKHSIDCEGRDVAGPIKLIDLESAMATLIKVLNFVTMYLLDGRQHGVLPQLPAGIYDHLDAPLIGPELARSAAMHWNQCDVRANGWSEVNSDFWRPTDPSGKRRPQN